VHPCWSSGQALTDCAQFEPWHMITSFLQYLLMAPSYIVVLNVSVFANVQYVRGIFQVAR
jgi:cellulose synthase/poly-beta-1,6-N-acetylglucosamine synthase-like glycosyltransferase